MWTDGDKIEFVYLEDWVGLYINGELEYEGHSIDEMRLLDILGVSYDWQEEYDDIGLTHLPNTLVEFEKITLESKEEEKALYDA